MKKTRKDLQDLINKLEDLLADANDVAEKAAKEYSSDPRANAEYEVGYLNGYINVALEIIREKSLENLTA
jgi:ElaB/YqjD/DUF883 family membrane-anchored ribosome-binding protein